MALAEAQLLATNAKVSELRDQLAAVSTDYKSQLAAKSAQLEEVAAASARLGQQLEGREADKRQAEGHAGETAEGIWGATFEK